MTRAKKARTARQRVAEMRAAQRRAQRRRRILAVVGAVVAVIVIAGGITAGVLTTRHGRPSASGKPGPEGVLLEAGPPLAPANTSANGKTVHGIACATSEQVAYHIHAHLAVYVNGKPRSLPAGVGLVNPVVQQTKNGAFAQGSRCSYWLHTHAADGIIHVESPSRRRYTLGDFFAIWRQPLSGSRVGPASGPVTVYVNGHKHTGDPGSIALREHEDIQLDVGRPLVPPRPVDWSGAQL